MENNVNDISQRVAFLMEAHELLSSNQDTTDQDINADGNDADSVCLNTGELTAYFPCDIFDVEVYENETPPPHCHILCDDWDIRVAISNGEILGTEKTGKDNLIYTYVEKYAPVWLNTPNAEFPSMTNRDVCEYVWKQNIS